MTNYVVCLKWGTKYSAEYVNRLHSMVERNLSLPYTFVCFTDDARGIDANIKCESLPDLPLQGWWYKLWFLSKEFPYNGTILFLDLDLIVFENIDRLFLHNPKSFCIIRDFNRSLNKNWNRVNSSVFRFESFEHSSVYDTFLSNHRTYTKHFHGDQDFMFKHIHNRSFWPDMWIQSYKWEMRDRRDLVRIENRLNFSTEKNPEIHKDTCIAVFHGDPNPQDCKDAWVIDNWR